MLAYYRLKMLYVHLCGPTGTPGAHFCRYSKHQWWWNYKTTSQIHCLELMDHNIPTLKRSFLYDIEIMLLSSTMFKVNQCQDRPMILSWYWCSTKYTNNVERLSRPKSELLDLEVGLVNNVLLCHRQKKGKHSITDGASLLSLHILYFCDLYIQSCILLLFIIVLA